MAKMNAASKLRENNMVNLQITLDNDYYVPKVSVYLCSTPILPSLMKRQYIQIPNFSGNVIEVFGSHF
jgi:hypothetical protein